MARASSNSQAAVAGAPPRPAPIANAYKARTVIGVINMKAPDGSPIRREVPAVEAIQQGIAQGGPVLTFGDVTVGPTPGRGQLGIPPAAMLADDRVLVTCPCGDAWPGSTQDRLSARAPEKAKPRHDGGQRVGPGYWLNKQRIGEWPSADCSEAQARLAFNIQYPGEIAAQKALREGKKPDEVARIRAVAQAKARGQSSGRNAVAAGDFAAALAAVGAQQAATAARMSEAPGEVVG